MTAHLLPDENLDDELYGRILALLGAVSGTNVFKPIGPGLIKMDENNIEVQIIKDKKSFTKAEFPNVKYSIPAAMEFPHSRRVAKWNDFFQEIAEHREQYHVPKGEFLILLTPLANRHNWFATLDENHPYNGFIHTAEWDHYLSCDPAIPIAFEVVTLMLQRYIFENYSRISKVAHHQPIGCVSDLCMMKNEIILKMRTADICPACMNRIVNKLSTPEIHHALSILESLRIKMLYSQNFKQNSPPSRMIIRAGGRIYLPDYSDVEIRMPTMEKAVYLLFLRHPEGIFLSSLVDFREELTEIYRKISTRGRLEDLNRRIDEVTNRLNEQMSIKISRIKKAFTDAVGKSLAEHYIIRGANAEKRTININRDLVEDLVK